MAKLKKVYVCSKCGHQEGKWLGKCPSCDEWSTLEEKIIEPEVKKGSVNKLVSSKGKPKTLNEIESDNSSRIISGIEEFDRIMGGGVVKDSVTIITAPPGVGKSTLTLEVSNRLSDKMKVLYVSGEESESQIKNRANRIIKQYNNNLYVVSEACIENIETYIEELDPKFIVIDSIQTLYSTESTSSPGSPTQVKECSNRLIRIAKNKNIPRAVIIIGQMTKDDELAGARSLEHAVDTVISLEKQGNEQLVQAVTGKNRYGNSEEIGLWEMTDEGLEEIRNPSSYFITQREDGDFVTGSALSIVKEGSRPIVVEIQSLTSKSIAPFPSRVATGIKREELNTLIPIMEEKAGFSLFDKNVIVKSTGGIKIKEPGVNLAIIMSIASSVRGFSIPNDTVFIGEVGLTGELIKVPSIEQRIKELDRMGFKKVIIPNQQLKTLKLNIDIVKCKTLKDVLDKTKNA